MILTAAQLSSIAIYSSQQRIATYLPMINDTLQKYGIDTPLRVCHFLAQIVHESGSLRYTTEEASGQAYEGNTKLGNTQPGDGPLFKGRGFIQLTGRANYQAYAEYLGVNVVLNPTLVSSMYPADVSGWFWKQKNLNAHADRDELTIITEIINGGTNGLSERLFWLGKAKSVLMPTH